MSLFKNSLAAGTVAIFALCVGPAMAQEIIHNQEDASSPFASSVIVPPGYTTYYISGSGPTGINLNAPKGSAESLGDTAQQTTTTWLASRSGLPNWA